jgi:dipeptidyl aminopeptidase/acylaminoacyl peptidase
MTLQRNYFGGSRRRITAFLLLTGLISLLLVGLVSCQAGNANNNQSLADARQAFVTKLRVRSPAPQSYQDETPPPNVQQVEYASGNLQLKGWLSQNSGNGKKQPAIVYLHGGWSFGADDWQDAAPFTQAGFVLFMPMLRAENGNPGVYESFLGEVDDAIAAGKFVASLPNIDPQNVFIVGHSVGGVLTTLVSMLPSPYKAAAAFDGYVDMASWAADSPDKAVPYDRENPEEVRIRNPLAFANSIQKPLQLYVGESRDVNQQLATKARKAGKDCQLITVAGDHQTMVEPAVQQSIKWFQTLATK